MLRYIYIYIYDFYLFKTGTTYYFFEILKVSQKGLKFYLASINNYYFLRKKK